MNQENQNIDISASQESEYVKRYYFAIGLGLAFLAKALNLFIVTPVIFLLMRLLSEAGAVGGILTVVINWIPAVGGFLLGVALVAYVHRRLKREDKEKGIRSLVSLRPSRAALHMVLGLVIPNMILYIAHTIAAAFLMKVFYGACISAGGC